MQIHEITDQIGNDMYGTLKCEHCGHIQKMRGGYDDANWHNRVLPAIKCASCTKDARSEISA